MESFVATCWLIAFVSFSYLGIRAWGISEEFKIWEYSIRASNANLMAIAMYEIHNTRIDNIEVLKTGRYKRL